MSLYEHDLKLFASLRQGRSEEIVVNCAIDSTVEVIIRDLGIPLDQVSIMLANDIPKSLHRGVAVDLAGLYFINYYDETA